MSTDVTPRVVTVDAPTTLEPYRATKLWNAVIGRFCAGLPLGRHRRHMKSYEHSFSGTEAVNWLHKHLLHDENFGPRVTRHQTLQLLQKLHKANVFEDVRGIKNRRELFAENGRLYRLVPTTPVRRRLEAMTVKTGGLSRAPLASVSDMMNTTRRSLRLPKRAAPTTKRRLHERAHSEGQLAGGATCRPPAADVQAVWLRMTLNELQRILKVSSLSEIVDTKLIAPHNIMHNMTQVNRNGIVTNISKRDQLPHWVISAMRCLAYWPEKVEENLPDYPGFQCEVFHIIKDYFESLVEPLIPTDMFDIFINVVASASGRRPSAGHRVTFSPMTSVENLLLDMTFDARCVDAQRGDVLIVHDDAPVTLPAAAPVSVSPGVALSPAARVLPRHYSSVSWRCETAEWPATVAAAVPSTYVCAAASRTWRLGPPPYRPPPSYPSVGELSAAAAAGSTACLAESYRQAIDGCEPVATPSGKSLYSGVRRSESSPCLLVETSCLRAVQSLQLCCLLLPPAGRRKLHLLLRLMYKMVNNRRLVMEADCTRRLVLDELTDCILRARPDGGEGAEGAASGGAVRHVVELMMDNYAEVMRVPRELRDQIEDRVAWLRKSQKVAEVDPNCPPLFCEQLTVRQYERQRFSASQRALQDLLNDIVTDSELSTRSKKKHLKQFQKNYPEIYSHRFPESGDEVESARPRAKQPLLRRPLERLRMMRL